MEGSLPERCQNCCSPAIDLYLSIDGDLWFCLKCAIIEIHKDNLHLYECIKDLQAQITKLKSELERFQGDV